MKPSLRTPHTLIKLLALSAMGAIGTISTVSTSQAADVGISVSIGQPGFYGRVNIGGYPPPTLLYPQPMIIEHVPYARPPIYLNVPPGHAKHWNKHCHHYGACGERVYFVQNNWYDRVYVPRYQQHHNHYYQDRGYRHDNHYENHNDGHGHGKHGGGHGHDGDGNSQGHGHGKH